MKRFEDSEFFGNGSDIIEKHPVDYKKELKSLNKYMHGFSIEERQREISSEALIRKDPSKLKYQNN